MEQFSETRPFKSIEKMGSQVGPISTFSKYNRGVILLLFLILGYLYFASHQIQDGTGSQGVFRIDEEPVAIAVGKDEPEDWLSEVGYVEQNLYSMSQDDPRLVKYVRYRYISPPASPDLEYNLKNPNWPSDHSQLILKLFNNKREGTFIESGANDGEYSHTFKLEKEFGWTGLLVECNPTVVPYLKSRHRKAWVAGVCLATADHAQKFNFSNPVSWTYSGRFGKPWDLPVKTNWTFFDVETIPLYTILQAISFETIDFWSFDVEGSEIQILKSLPFDKINIKVIICEIYFYNATERADLDAFMGTKGYKIYPHNFSIDQVYVHKSFPAE